MKNTFIKSVKSAGILFFAFLSYMSTLGDGIDVIGKVKSFFQDIGDKEDIRIVELSINNISNLLDKFAYDIKNGVSEEKRYTLITNLRKEANDLETALNKLNLKFSIKTYSNNPTFMNTSLDKASKMWSSQKAIRMLREDIESIPQINSDNLKCNKSRVDPKIRIDYDNQMEIEVLNNDEIKKDTNAFIDCLILGRENPFKYNEIGLFEISFMKIKMDLDYLKLAVDIGINKRYSSIYYCDPDFRYKCKAEDSMKNTKYEYMKIMVPARYVREIEK